MSFSATLAQRSFSSRESLFHFPELGLGRFHASYAVTGGCSTLAFFVRSREAFIVVSTARAAAEDVGNDPLRFCCEADAAAAEWAVDSRLPPALADGADEAAAAAAELSRALADGADDSRLPSAFVDEADVVDEAEWANGLDDVDGSNSSLSLRLVMSANAFETFFAEGVTADTSGNISTICLGEQTKV